MLLVSASKIFFDSDDILKVISVDSDGNQLNIHVQGKQKTGLCPNCLCPSGKLHSYYSRKLDDLPAFGKATKIFLRSRKFYCLTHGCPFKIFTERLDCHFKAYKRTTERLEKKLLSIALEAGGKPAEHISRQFSISVSDTTLLRMISKASLPNYCTITAVGVDDCGAARAGF